MRSYLSLIPLSAKVHRRQNRMTLLCIIFSVFLVTAIFSSAEMGVRCEMMHAKETHGDWQLQIADLSESGAAAIASRDDVAASSWYEVANLDQSRAYTISGHQTALCGVEQDFLTEIMHYFDDDASLAEKDAVILTPNARTLLGVAPGNTVTLETPAGSYDFTVEGFRSSDSRFASGNGGGETTALLVEDEQIGAFVNIAALRSILAANDDSGQTSYFVQFADDAHIRQAIDDIKIVCGLEDNQLTENFILMGLAGLSSNELVRNLYPLVGGLFVLILVAGVLMIAGSLNSTTSQRTQFFGMMRCIGMSRAQVRRFVRLEALNWCKTAIPIGVVLGIVLTWGLGAVLRYGVGGEFSDWPIFGVSGIGIASGVVLGIATVLIAAQSPARRAARVSPMAAVSTAAATRAGKPQRIHGRIISIASRLGIAHATAAKKNLVLMSGSFALSIVLFLGFSVLVQLLNCLLPTSLSAPDLSIQSRDWSNNVDHTLVEELADMPGVAHAFGRSSLTDVPASFSVAAEQESVDLISYDDIQFDWLPEDEMLRDGAGLAAVYGDSHSVLTIWDETNPLSVGDTVTLGDETVTIAGLLKYSPFTNSGSTEGSIDLISSDETFQRLTGESDYGIIDVQLTEDASDAEVAAIAERASSAGQFVDRRDEADRSTFWAFSLFIYGFLAIIALITVLNIVNSISMSVTARTREYGAMRAVGMDGSQLTRMIAAEAATYAVSGSLCGIALGLPLHKLLYERLITAHFPYYSWEFPTAALSIIVCFILFATICAFISPAKRLRRLAVCETLAEL